jgi:ABC-2 type transport system ATP-binding protein
MACSFYQEMKMIKTDGLTKKFGELVAVDQLSLEIEAGEVFGFLGPNGAGKTTTIRLLGALIGPSSGSANVAGFDIEKDDQRIRQNVGILTESPGLYDRLSAERNLGFFAAMYDVGDVAGQVETYLRLLGLWDRRQEAAGTFSKGMRQKLAIARALLHEPPVLFLDEPTSGLDPEAARLVREFIAGLKKEGRTIFMCTHNLAEADRLCDRVGVFNSRLLAMGTPATLRRSIYGRTIVVHLSQLADGYQSVVQDFGFVQTIKAVENKLVITIDDPEAQNPVLIRKLVEAGADVQFVGEMRRSLEDVYLRLMENVTEQQKS